MKIGSVERMMMMMMMMMMRGRIDTSEDEELNKVLVVVCDEADVYLTMGQG